MRPAHLRVPQGARAKGDLALLKGNDAAEAAGPQLHQLQLPPDHRHTGQRQRLLALQEARPPGRLASPAALALAFALAFALALLAAAAAAALALAVAVLAAGTRPALALALVAAGTRPALVAALAVPGVAAALLQRGLGPPQRLRHQLLPLAARAQRTDPHVAHCRPAEVARGYAHGRRDCGGQCALRLRCCCCCRRRRRRRRRAIAAAVHVGRGWACAWACAWGCGWAQGWSRSGRSRGLWGRGHRGVVAEANAGQETSPGEVVSGAAVRRLTGKLNDGSRTRPL